MCKQCPSKRNDSQDIIYHQMKKDSALDETLLTERSIDPQPPPRSPQVGGKSCFQQILFSWLHPFLKRGSAQPVTIPSMPRLPHESTTSPLSARISASWASTQRRPTPGATLAISAAKTFRRQLIIILILMILVVGLNLLNPFITSFNINYIQEHSGNIRYGLLLFFATLLLQIVVSILYAQLIFKFSMLGVDLNNAFVMMIYGKAFRFSCLASKEFNESEVINYSQIDAERMSYIGVHFAAFFYGPIELIVGLIMMYHFVQISFLAAIGVMVVLFFVTLVIATISAKINEQTLKMKDQRMKVTQEMLDIIRYIKISVIEKYFYDLVDQQRVREVALIVRKGVWFVVTIITFYMTSPIMLSATFFTYVMLGNEMSPHVAFATIQIAGIVQGPLFSMPEAISELLLVKVSFERIEKFLFAQEIREGGYRYKPAGEEQAVVIRSGDFYWGKEPPKKKEDGGDEEEDKEEESQRKKMLKRQQEQKQKQSVQGQDGYNQVLYQQIFPDDPKPPSKPKKQSQPEPQPLQNKLIHVLKDINTSIQRGKLVMVVGDIGSGKSSLLLALLNEMHPHPHSQVSISGSVAYCPQKAWIMSKTVRQNITFTLPFNASKFEDVVHHASLTQDIKMLPKGVQTEIGQKGVNISGGQKARIGLARALYSQQDVYLLDDILSAVDVHVGEFLLSQTLKKYLKGKTVIMPTHAVRFLPEADEIIVMKKGRIVRKGHYDDISETAQFQQVCKVEEDKEDKKEEEPTDQDQKAIENELDMLASVMKSKSKSKAKSKDRSLSHDASQQDERMQGMIEQLMLPQDEEKGEVKLSVIKQYIKQGGGMFKFVVLVGFMQLCWHACSVLSSVVMERWCADPRGDSSEVYFYIGLTVISPVFIFCEAYFLIVSTSKQSTAIHRDMIKGLLYASLSDFYNRVPIGRIVNRLTNDLTHLDQVIGDLVGYFVNCVFELLGTLIICMYASSPLAVIPMIIVGIAANRLRVYFMKTQRQVARLEKSAKSPVVSGFMATIQGLPSIRAYQKSYEFTQMQVDTMDDQKTVSMNKVAMENWFSLWLAFLSFCVNMPCLAYCMFSHQDNPALVGMLMAYSLSLSENIVALTLSASEVETQFVSLERVYNFSRIAPEVGYKGYCEEWDPVEQGAGSCVKEGRIDFVGLNARYRKDLPDVLSDISCRVEPGEKVGIVGRTGAGKTTLINTLLRVTHISSGKILIDGQSFMDLPLKALRHSITMIDQEPTLIKDSFRHNLDLDQRYTDQQLEEVLDECNLLEVVREKGGLEGMVSNESLSVGERQLLCICRAFLKKSQIVLIDEATANIDAKNDAMIQKIITEKFRGSTVLTIAHRLSTLQNSDKIMVMEKGKLVEFGSPSELEQKEGGFYAQMMKKNSQDMLK